MQELLSDGSYSTLFIDSERPSSNVLDGPRNQPEDKPGSRRSSGAGSWQQQASEELYSQDGDGDWEAAEERTSGDPRTAAPAMPEGGSLTGPSQEESYRDSTEGKGPHPPPPTQAPPKDDISSYAMSFSESDAEEGPAQLSLEAQAAALEDSWASEAHLSPPQQDSDGSYTDQEGSEGAGPDFDEQRGSSNTTGSAGPQPPPPISLGIPDPGIEEQGVKGWEGGPIPPPSVSPTEFSGSRGQGSPNQGHAAAAPDPPRSRSETTEQQHQDHHTAAAPEPPSSSVETTEQWHHGPYAAAPEESAVQAQSKAEEHSQLQQHPPPAEQEAASAPGPTGPHPLPAEQSPRQSFTDQEEGALDNQGTAAAAAAAAHAQSHLPPPQQEPSKPYEDDGEGGDGQDQGFTAAATAAAVRGKPHPPVACQSPSPSNMDQEEGAGINQDVAAVAGEREQPPSPFVQEEPRASRSNEGKDANQSAAAAAAAAAAAVELDPFPPPPVPHQGSSRSSTEEEGDGAAGPGAAAAAAATAAEPNPFPLHHSYSRPRTEEEEDGVAGHGAAAAAAAAAAARRCM